ncbi:hypothetical protein DdX_19687 [Ditylenchus destructor]|uniref:Uncharacterized protein n=1 Tax=Ditylenchus destructor TaxID=166010 RepID=A0AAD4MHI3_9BILA|nr:hypothetical protein DdX_19687 [Ditylenchus destructor]
MTTPSTSSQSCILEQTPRGTKRAKSEFSGTSSKDSMELKRSQLLDLEIESRLLDIQLKKRQIYKSDLEIHSMECELQIPHKFLHITPHCEIDTNLEGKPWKPEGDLMVVRQPVKVAPMSEPQWPTLELIEEQIKSDGICLTYRNDVFKFLKEKFIRK